MSVVRAWSMSDHYVSLNGQLVSEFAEGDGVAVSLTDDDTMFAQGANGAAVGSFKYNRVVEITITLLQGSPDNARLQALVDTILTARRGSIAIEVNDGRGETIFSVPQGLPKKRPDYTMATEAGSVAWVFHGVAEVFQIGGNESA